MDKINATVIKSTGSWYRVMADDGRHFQARIRGKMRLHGIKATNPVAVGDRVVIEWSGNPEEASIVAIQARKNYIIRKATKQSRQSHIVAANIDRLVVIATLTSPRTSSGFIDRFLTAAEAYHIPSVIVFNKTDLYDQNLMDQLAERQNAYQDIGYSVISCSVVSGENLDLVDLILSKGLSLLAGHSGAGKSALINAIDPGMNLKTGELSHIHQKGKHTTTFAEMLPLSNGGWIIDSPGVKEFGLLDFEPAELSQRFPEMRALMHRCHFNNCLHVNEPKCAVKQALEQHKIADFRYKNYLNMLEDINQK